MATRKTVIKEKRNPKKSASANKKSDNPSVKTSMRSSGASNNGSTSAGA